jgi:3',5'-cyclic AMP phosphodiesterase CpdA
MKTRWPILVLVISLLAGCNAHTAAPVASTPATVAAAPIALPNANGSLKFVVLGDFGTGGRGQYDLAARMAQFHDGFKFDTAVTVGDNLYGSQRPRDYQTKFEIPYKPLLDAGVKFYASLGNHDSREQMNYGLFNMGGKLYYAFKAPAQSVRFFMLDSNYLSPEQLSWLETELKGSASDWKIAVFHHPLYSSGGRHGSDVKARQALEDLFVANNVSVVFSGHDHFYERIEPQRGIMYFVVGSGGQLASGNIDKRSLLTAAGFDTGNVFMAIEIMKDKMYFNAIATDGRVVDSGVVERRMLVSQP